MATLSTNQTGASAEYLRYSYGAITKTDSVSNPTLLDFRLVRGDSSFVKINRGAYITLTTEQYGVWFTGFITNDSELEFLGTENVNGVATPQFGYVYQATSDDYLLNLKPIGIIPPFVNTTQGAVIRYLIDHLSPAGWDFDVSGVQDGQIITRLVVDPAQKFSEAVKALADAANYQFRILNKVVTYVRQDLAPCGIVVDGTSRHFTPSRLKLQPVADPVVNDSIVIGDVEPQVYFNEYFVGDGITAAFPLVNSVYGVDSTVLLDDNFSNSQIDNTKWTLVDAVNSYLQPLNGFLNVLGGNNVGTFDIYLQSQSLIPIEGNLRLTHGEFDFVTASDGIICSLWTQDCSSKLSDCLYGIRCTKSGLNTVLNPLCNGILDTTQSFTVDYTKRYNIRTLFGCQHLMRLTPERSYKNSDGSIETVGGTSIPTIGYFHTILTEIDPTTGLVTQQVTFYSNEVAITAEANAAYYCSVVSNDLHLTVTGVTISSPMQTSLNIRAAGTTTYLPQLMGTNEIDSVDGLAPLATIVDSNSGATSRSSVLGTPIFNTGQATLTFFKDTIRQITTTPQIGDIIHLGYRVPGAALGRVQSRASLASEGAAFKDDGLRTAVIHDMTPLPRTSEECEQAAAAYVATYGYQHYQGTYVMPSGYWFSSEPRSGTVLRFINFEGIAGFPSYLQSEAVTEVVTTLDGNINQTAIPHPGYGSNIWERDEWGDQAGTSKTSVSEIFTHTITFGPLNKLTKFLSTLKSNADVFVIQDTAEIPTFVDVSAVGLSNAVDVTSPVLTGWDASYLYFDVGLTPAPGISFEIRYSDSSWGSTSASNLITRIGAGATAFKVPRTSKGRVCFVRAFDSRNVFPWSDDLTQMPTTVPGNSLANAIGKNPENNHTQITTYTPVTPGAALDWYSGINPAGANGCWSMSFRATAATTVSMSMYFRRSDGSLDPAAFTLTHTCSGGWERLSLPFAWTASYTGTLIYRIASSAPVEICHASTEMNTQEETVFCATNGGAYGATSRVSSGIRVAFPLIPPAPTGYLDYNDPSNPIVNITLPTVLEDVWGVEVRADDNTTVIFHSNLDSVGYVPLYTVANNTSRSLSFWLYTYNILGEYSAGYNLVALIPLPLVTNLAVNDNKFLTWTASEASISFEVSIVADPLLHLVGANSAATTKDTVWVLSDQDFFLTRYMTVTPSDTIGPGNPSTVLVHQYTPDGVAEFNDNEVAAIPSPTATGQVIVSPGTPLSPYAGAVDNHSQYLYSLS